MKHTDEANHEKCNNSGTPGLSLYRLLRSSANTENVWESINIRKKEDQFTSACIQALIPVANLLKNGQAKTKRNEWERE